MSEDDADPDRVGSRGDTADRSGTVANWVLVEGNRLVLAGAATAIVLLGFLVLLRVYGPAVLAPNSPVNFLFSALVTGDLTLLTVVLSINQVVLSRELGEPGTFRRRIGEAIDYRRAVESTTGTAVSPNAPAEFLRFLHEQLDDEASVLAAASRGVEDGPCRSRLGSLVESLRADVRRVNETLEGSGGVFTVVSATLATDHTDQFQEIARLRRRHADALSDEARETLSSIEELLVGIDVARQYFKTVFVMKELAYLSRVLLYVGVPAIVGCGLVLALYNAAGSVPVSVGVRALAVSAAFAAGFAPLAVLFAFTLRLAWVSQRSSTTAPFAAASVYRP